MITTNNKKSYLVSILFVNTPFFSPFSNNKETMIVCAVFPKMWIALKYDLYKSQFGVLIQTVAKPYLKSTTMTCLIERVPSGGRDDVTHF